jgi:hypothetical protein
MKTIEVGSRILGKLPNIPHHFSTLILREHDGVDQYYELKAKYHGTYASSTQFKVGWQYYTRVLNDAEAAIRLRTVKVLKRSDVSVLQFKYMATVKFYDPGTKGQEVRAMRHISRVVLSDFGFITLYDNGMLRLLHEGESGSTSQEKVRAMIYGLSPFQARIANAVAA